MAEEKILIADDDPAVRRLLIRVVEGSGFQAVTACDGTEAVHLASRESFALILLDIMMNGNDDGFHAIKRLRESGNTTPIMVLSGRTDDFDTLTAWTSELTTTFQSLLIPSFWAERSKP